MLTDHLTTRKSQIGDIANLYHLTTQNKLEQQFNTFLISCKVDGAAAATLRNYRYKLGRFIYFCLGLSIDDAVKVTTNDIRIFIGRLQETQGSISVHDYYKITHIFFNWLVREGIVTDSPMARLHPPRTVQKVIRPFTPDHIRGLLMLCDSTKFLGIRNRALILVAVDTGLRLGELAGIQLNDIDFDREIIKVMGKGAKERIVRIGKECQKALLRYLLMRKSDLSNLWLNEWGKPLTAWGIQCVVRQLKKRAGFTDVRVSPHTFRHTFATFALRNGAGLRDVQTLLGHSSLRMTLRYAATVNSEDAVKRHKEWSPVDNLKL